MVGAPLQQSRWGVVSHCCGVSLEWNPSMRVHLWVPARLLVLLVPYRAVCSVGVGVERGGWGLVGGLFWHAVGP